MDPTQHTAEGASPSVEAAFPRPQPSPRSILSRLEPSASLARHKRLAWSLLLLISCAGLPIAYVKGKPDYYTQAVVFIAPRLIQNPQGDEEFQPQSKQQYREYLQQHVRRISRLDIAQSTLKQLGENGQLWWRRPQETDRRAAERLAGALIITPVPDNYQMTVGLRCDKPQGVAEIVNTLVGVYIAVQKSEELESVGTRLRALQQEIDRLGKEIANNQARKRRETLEERKKFLDLGSRAPGFVRVLSSAQPAVLLADGGRTKFALLFCLAGLVLAFLVPVAVDVADPRLLVPSDVSRALGFDPLGWVPESTELGEEFTWDLVLRLANRIDQERRTHGARIWMFTGVKSGGGTTTLVNSLGRALVVLGIPTLAVEANPYRAAGRFARSSAGPGLSMLLRGHSTLSESIETGGGEMPDHIPAGELDGTGHLPDIHRLMEILGEALQSYALVLVDMPPVLASVDSEYLARRADRVVLVAEARKVMVPELKRAAKVLERIQPKAVACILNRVHSADGGGFAQEARREFETGAAKPELAW